MERKPKENNFQSLIAFRTTEYQKELVKQWTKEEMCSEAVIMRRIIGFYERHRNEFER